MFAENDRISHRQLFRQIVLSMIAPFFLCLTSWGNFRGMNGILGLAAAAVFLAFYGIFLVRLAPAYEYAMKHAGKGQLVLLVVIYGLYILFSAAYLLDFISVIIGQYLLSGVNVLYIKIAVWAVCTAGSHKGLQKRARMGEVSYRIIIGALALLLVLAACQGDLFSFEELGKDVITGEAVARSGYEVLCAFLPFTLLPFLLTHVAKSSSSVKSLWKAVGVLMVFLMAALLLMPLALGWERIVQENIPVLPLLMGTNLPGDILARFDVIWIVLFVYGFLYSMGSLFYYANHIFYRISLPMNRWVFGLLVLLVSGFPFWGYEIADYYGSFLSLVAAPLLFLVTIYMYFWHRRKNS